MHIEIENPAAAKFLRFSGTDHPFDKTGSGADHAFSFDRCPAGFRESEIWMASGRAFAVYFKAGAICFSQVPARNFAPTTGHPTAGQAVSRRHRPAGRPAAGTGSIGNSTKSG